MSIVQAVDRMQQIAATIRQLTGQAAPQTAASSGVGTAAAGSTDFANALAGATAPSGVAATAAAGSPTPGGTTTAVAGSLVRNGVTGADVVADARKYLGVPYVFGGTTSAGLDCSGLVQKVYGDLGISVPRLVTGQGEVGVAVPSIAQARPGDLIVCNGGEHIAIYAGDGKIIESPHTGSHVMERADWISPSNTVTIRRIVPQSAPAASGTSSTSGTAAGVDSLLFSLMAGRA